MAFTCEITNVLARVARVNFYGLSGEALNNRHFTKRYIIFIDGRFVLCVIGSYQCIYLTKYRDP